jgi:hypothetical protein
MPTRIITPRYTRRRRDALWAQPTNRTKSENRLVEDGIELNGGRVVAEAREFVDSLTGDAVDIEFAKALIDHYRPPKRPRTAVRGPEEVQSAAL